MANVVLPYLIPMMLGKTIDLTCYTMGGQMYDDYAFEETRLDTVSHTYTVLKENNGLPYDDIGYSVDLNLRIKADHLKSQIDYDLNVDKLFRTKYWYTPTSAVVGVTSKIMKTKRTLREDVQPPEGWQDKVSDTQTHFVNSMIYGGLNYYFYEYECFTAEDAAIVRKVLLSKLGEHGEINNATIDTWIDASEEIFNHPDIRKECNYYKYTYTTMDIRSIYYPGLRGMLRTMADMPEAVGDGVPIFIELTPLHDLDEKFPAVTENHDFDIELDKIAEMYDDIRKTHARLIKWMKKSEKGFNEEDFEKIKNFEDHLLACEEKFKEVAKEISNFKQLDPSMWQPAVSFYQSKLQGKVHSYIYLFIDLRQDIEPDCKESFFHKIKGLLEVNDDEQIVHGHVDVANCRKACLELEEPKCVAIGHPADEKCYLYFRGSATRNVTGPMNSAVYNRDCEFSYYWN